ncbi:MAG TPA: hypothetical protein VIH90_08385 [Candidatus Saccharimonadales bacterium]
MKSISKLTQGVFKDKEGHIVIIQSPNLALSCWILIELITHLLHQGHIKNSLQDIGTAFLFTWAFLEITKGSNYFRRFLGFAVFVTIIVSFFKY